MKREIDPILSLFYRPIRSDSDRLTALLMILQHCGLEKELMSLPLDAAWASLENEERRYWSPIRFLQGLTFWDVVNAVLRHSQSVEDVQRWVSLATSLYGPEYRYRPIPGGRSPCDVDQREFSFAEAVAHLFKEQMYWMQDFEEEHGRLTRQVCREFGCWTEEDEAFYQKVIARWTTGN